MDKKKIIKICILIIVFLSIMVHNVQAISNDNINDIESTEEVQSLYNYITNMKTQYEILKDINPKEYIKNFIKNGKGQCSFKEFVKALNTYIFKEIVNSADIIVKILVIVLICSLLTNLQNAFSNENISNVAYFACYSLLIIVLAKSFHIGVDLVSTTINEMKNFMTASIPVLLMLLASMGGFAESTIMNPIIIGSINIFTGIYVNFIVPVILLSFILNFVNNMCDDYKIKGITKLLKQISLWTQGIIMTVFIGIISIRGFNSKALDEVTSKTVKYAVDNFVPVVGKCLSDAISSVAGYSFLFKNAISTLALIILIIIVIMPTIKMAIISLMYKIAAALVEPISDTKIVNCLEGAGDSMVLLMSCLICVSFMFFIMICIMASAGGGVIGR